MHRHRPAEVTQPSDTEVRVTRDFDAPRDFVYRAWTDPALLRRWLTGPPGWRMTECEMDVRRGGGFRWRWAPEGDGQGFGLHGEFLQVTPEARLVHSQFHETNGAGAPEEEGTKVSVTFGEDDGVTTVTTTLEFKSEADRDAAVATGMTDGMEASYAKLDALARSGGPG